MIPNEVLRDRMRGNRLSDRRFADAAGVSVEAVVVDSATLWIAFERAGIPNADFARHELGRRLDARFWLVSEAGEVREWSSLANAKVDAD